MLLFVRFVLEVRVLLVIVGLDDFVVNFLVDVLFGNLLGLFNVSMFILSGKLGIKCLIVFFKRGLMMNLVLLILLSNCCVFILLVLIK